jgi:hypothetical protein
MTTSPDRLEDLALRSGMRSEHVLLEGNGTDETFAPTDQLRREHLHGLRLSNRARGTETKIDLFDSGYMEIRETRSGRQHREFGVDLRYLDTRPFRSRRIAKAMSQITLLLAGLSLVVGLVAYFAPAQIIRSLIIVAAIGALPAALWILATRTEEQTSFRTRHGRAIVFTMVASYGCLRASRAITREVVTAIDRTRRQGKQDKQSLLRGEIREHYRLLEDGSLPAAVCSAAVRRVLAHFE